MTSSSAQTNFSTEIKRHRITERSRMDCRIGYGCEKDRLMQKNIAVRLAHHSLVLQPTHVYFVCITLNLVEFQFKNIIHFLNISKSFSL